jgi:hypothetical protein
MALRKKSHLQNPTPADAHYARDLSPPGSPQTILGANLRASVVDPVHDKIMGHSFVRGGPKSADENIDDQLRTVSSEQYPAAHGQVSRQVSSGSPGGTVPATCGASAAPDPKEPN